jgi:cell division ATPase FtsA
MIDVGAGTSDISITNDGSVISFGMIPCAGDSITEAIAKACLIDFGMAEQVKIAAAEQDTIVYEDIMGLEQTITADEVLKICQPQIEKMARLAAEEIKSLNGGESPSAVFIVGGGGKIKGFTEMVASELGLDSKRVALRGEEIMKDIQFPEEALKDSTIITPIGICLTYYDQNNNFIHVNFNDKKIKMYDNNKLTVMDAAIAASFARDGLFARKGEDLRYTLNGKRQNLRGGFGEPARIFVNDEEVNLSYPIRSNDKIRIEAATVGKSAIVKISDIEEYNSTIDFTINGDVVTMPVLAKVNGLLENGEYQIKTGDRVEVPCDYILENVLDFMKLSPNNLVMTVNGNEADLDYKLIANDVIELNERTSTSDSPQQEPPRYSQTPENTEEVSGDKLLVIVNDKPVVMSGKSAYTFVDVFDYIDFDTTTMQGKGIATIVNGRDAVYTQPLHAGDKIEIYWRKN